MRKTISMVIASSAVIEVYPASAHSPRSITAPSPPPATAMPPARAAAGSDGETLAAAMRATGDTVEQKTFPGVTHEFFGMAKVVSGPRQANDLAVARLKAAFAR